MRVCNLSLDPCQSSRRGVELLDRPRARSALSLDVGRRRIGLAGCDGLGLTVTPLNALNRGAFSSDLRQLKKLCAERRVEALVIGLPLDDEGNPTMQARHCQRYGTRLARALSLPMALVNEHSSSWAAGERHRLHGDRFLPKEVCICVVRCPEDVPWPYSVSHWPGCRNDVTVNG